MKKGKTENILNILLTTVCVILGSCIVSWTTSIQGNFLTQIGVSSLGAMTVEPLLVLTSFLLGIKITKSHRFVASVFLIILFGISLLMMVSMYSQKSLMSLEHSKATSVVSKKSIDTNDVIKKTLEGLNDRGTTSSKNITKVIDQLQKQDDKVSKVVLSDGGELRAIIEAIGSFLMIDEKKAVLFFSFFVSLAAVFSPSFLFFSAGMLIRNTGIFNIKTDQSKRMDDLSLKQKIVLLARDNVSKDPKELAKFLETTEGVVKSQLSRIGKKVKFDDKKEEIKSEELKPKKRKYVRKNRDV